MEEEKKVGEEASEEVTDEPVVPEGETVAEPAPA